MYPPQVSSLIVVKQELAKEGVLPFSNFWESDRPFRTPAAALLLHWIFAAVIIVAPPPGEAYFFIIDLQSYQGACFSALICGGLLWLQYRKSEHWESPFHSYLPFTLIALLSSLILVSVPFMPPAAGKGGSIPYFVFPVVGLGTLFIGVGYWVVYAKVLPRIGGYEISVEREVREDGMEVVRHRRIKKVDTPEVVEAVEARN